MTDTKALRVDNVSLTRMLGNLCQYVEECGEADFMSGVPGLPEWWEIRQAAGRHREESERKAKDEKHAKQAERYRISEIQRQGLAKLTDEEAVYLGLATIENVVTAQAAMEEQYRWMSINLPSYDRFTDNAKKTMQMANQEAQRFNHEYVGTEHILLGLVRRQGTTGSNILESFGIDLRKIRLEVEKLIQAGPDMVTMGKLPQTPRAKKVIEYTMEEARSLNHNYVSTKHILLGLLRESEGVAARVLMELGVKIEVVRDAAS